MGQARSHFEHWFESAITFYETFETNLAKGVTGPRFLRNAAFQLHQAAENLYHTLLLVFTGHKPKLHDLEKLKRLTGGFGKEILTIFPTVTEEERYRFQLLRRAYTEARYEPGYRIEKEDRDYLGERVCRLQEAVKPLCERRIAQYEEEAREWKEGRG